MSAKAASWVINAKFHALKDFGVSVANINVTVRMMLSVTPLRVLA